MQNNSPQPTSKKVGVIIPIYNVEQYLRECLDSVINQTYKNLEIILVNDGSTRKENLKIAKEYVLKDSRFILFDKENGGLSSARNVGIEYFSGNIKLQKSNTGNSAAKSLQSYQSNKVKYEHESQMQRSLSGGEAGFTSAETIPNNELGGGIILT